MKKVFDMKCNDTVDLLVLLLLDSEYEYIQERYTRPIHTGIVNSYSVEHTENWTKITILGE